MTGLIVSTSIVTVTMVVAGLGGIHQWFPGQPDSVIYIAAGVNLLAGWISFIPLALVSRSQLTEYVPQAAMGAMVIRILIVAFVLLGLMTWGPWDSQAVSISMVVFYLALLIVETIIALRLVKQFYSDGENAQR